MKTKLKNEQELTMGKNENPVDFIRRIRKAYWESFDNDIDKVYEDIKKYQELHKDRLVDINLLRKKELLK